MPPFHRLGQFPLAASHVHKAQALARNGYEEEAFPEKHECHPETDSLLASVRRSDCSARGPGFLGHSRCQRGEPCSAQLYTTATVACAHRLYCFTAYSAHAHPWNNSPLPGDAHDSVDAYGAVDPHVSVDSGCTANSLRADASTASAVLFHMECIHASGEFPPTAQQSHGRQPNRKTSITISCKACRTTAASTYAASICAASLTTAGTTTTDIIAASTTAAGTTAASLTATGNAAASTAFNPAVIKASAVRHRESSACSSSVEQVRIGAVLYLQHLFCNLQFDGLTQRSSRKRATQAKTKPTRRNWRRCAPRPKLSLWRMLCHVLWEDELRRTSKRKAARKKAAPELSVTHAKLCSKDKRRDGMCPRLSPNCCRRSADPRTCLRSQYRRSHPRGHSSSQFFSADQDTNPQGATEVLRRIKFARWSQGTVLATPPFCKLYLEEFHRKNIVLFSVTKEAAST